MTATRARRSHSPENRRPACSCRGHLDPESDGPGGHRICSYCFGEEDPIQPRRPDWSGGANRSSLIEAQRRYAASEPSMSGSRRTSRNRRGNTSHDALFRSIGPCVDSFEPSGSRPRRSRPR
ncbi:CPCC family cysteine-rich protein [Stackebrandtia soli]|uniref:CPCC family cysteine-rich protein n=1 Tax=Stackebrandtia soli TaxID=1892856 RepID=UPI0039EBF81C